MKIYESRHHDIDLPNVDTLTLLFDSSRGQSEEGNKIHVDAANPSNCITKSEVRQLTQRIAHALRTSYGVGKKGPGKDVVLTAVEGSPFAPVFFSGVVAAGGVYCGAGTDSRVSELARQVEDSGAGLLVYSAESAERMLEVARESGISEDRVLILDCSTAGQWKLLTANDGRDVLAAGLGKTLDWQRITDRKVLEETTICLLYSSGTTGLPKGVRISHRALVANNICTMDPAIRYQVHCQAQGKPFRFDTIAHLPMSNIAGISLYATNPFYMGGTTYWMKKYNFEEFIEYHRKYRPAYQFSVPPVWLRIAKDDRVTHHFDGLRIAVTGSAPIGEGTVRDVRGKLGKGKALIAQTWGATEACGVITALDWPEFDRTGIWSVGELCPNVRLRVVDDNDKDVEEGQIGELLVAGPILAQGYHNRPDADKESFVDGFYRSGDIGTIKDGHVSIVDRNKEMIKYKGAQIAPAELEGLLTSHPEIADAAVIGVWAEERQTEVPRAYVVRYPGSQITGEEVVDFVKGRVAAYKRLRGGVVFVEIIPKSASGKILRKELRLRAKEKVQAKL